VEAKAPSPLVNPSADATNETKAASISSFSSLDLPHIPPVSASQQALLGLGSLFCFFSSEATFSAIQTIMKPISNSLNRAKRTSR
jgi:hypothetical protein